MNAQSGARRWVLFILGASAIAVGCEPGWFLYARNDTDQTHLLRVASPTFTDVFSIPPRFDGYVDTESAEFDARLEVLTEGCTVLSAAVPPTRGYLKATIGAGGSISIDEIPSDHDSTQEAEELRGVCGSTRAPDEVPENP